MQAALLQDGCPLFSCRNKGGLLFYQRRDIAVKQGKPIQIRGYIVFDERICSGCRTCEAVCSLSHEGAVSSHLSRIQVVTWPFEGYRSDIHTCLQCEDPECMAVCPTGALQRDELTGALIIGEEACTGCKACMDACSQTPSRIRYDEQRSICVKCDLCGGTPLCVKYCMEGALSFKKG